MKISSSIGALKHIRSHVPMTLLLTMYNSLIQPQFDYCSVVWEGLGINLTDKLQKLQNGAARIITHSPFNASSGPLLESLGYQLIGAKLLAVEMFKVYNNLVPPCLLEKFTKSQNAYNLRGSSTKLSLPLPKTNFGTDAK